MGEKSSRFDLEWLVVSKRLIYTIVAVLVLLPLSIYLWKYTSLFKRTGGQEAITAGARFDSFEGDVRVVRAETRESLQVRNDTRLLPGDIVQTQADGRARITLVDGSTMVIGPNSVITIGDNTSTDDGKRTNVRVAVDRGQIKMRTDQQAEGTNNVVETPLTKNRLAAQTAAIFGVREDKSEEFRVTEGSMETSTRGGESTTIRGGEYIALNQTGGIKTRERLLDVPAPSSPRNLEKVQARSNGSANVSLRWERPASGAPAYYRVEVATSPFFVAAGKVIERDQLVANEFNVGDLRAGNYFWRVRAIATSNQVSEWSEPQKFIVSSSEGTGESVQLAEVTSEYLGGNIYLLRGRAQPGATVRAAGRETIATSSGQFQFQINAGRGQREVTLEAEDSQGNKNSARVQLAPAAASS
ncbi:MAG TPA: FecR domain-containing protein [Pyrinomonadaceae bacterium]|jgi:hypothetical protein